jgi:hypothetical protein
MEQHDLKLDANLRYETKYRINYYQYYKIKNGIYPFVNMDAYTKKAVQNRYLVRSLYYDTFDHQIYIEKINGDCDRVKYRIRSYGDSVDLDPDIRIEMKIRRGDLTEKYSTLIDMTEYWHFQRTMHWGNQSDPVLMEFERQLHQRGLETKTLVEYRREGYESLDGNNIRITFDHEIRSASATALFDGRYFWHRHHDQLIVLEIKHRGKIQSWLTEVIKNNQIHVVANSKFALGTEASQYDLFMPAWSKG